MLESMALKFQLLTTLRFYVLNSPACILSRTKKLHTCQNTALPTIKGCLLMFFLEHLWYIVGPPCFQSRNTMHSIQAVSAGMFLQKPLLGASRGRRDYVDNIEEYADQATNATNFRNALIASGAISNLTLPVNSVLGVKAPPLANKELESPKKCRVTLAQFHSGNCSRLNSYLSVINSDMPNIRPACNRVQHVQRHYNFINYLLLLGWFSDWPQ